MRTPTSCLTTRPPRRVATPPDSDAAFHTPPRAYDTSQPREREGERERGREGGREREKIVRPTYILF